MTGGRVRAAAHAVVEGLAARLSRSLADADMAAPAIVFAPHQDDETLGCGGLIALKRARGVPVTVVFLTDGRTSHARFLEAGELASRRRAEALAACGELGVAAVDVHFLDFRDGELTGGIAAAAARIAGLLRLHPGALLLAPYAGDTTADHQATLAAVLGGIALQEPGTTRVLLEYPVWFWHHWPWVCPPVARRLHRPGVVLAGLRACGQRLAHLKHRVEIAAVAGTKRRALDCHATQMSRPADQPRWPVLADVAGGQWLSMFFRGREYLRRREIVAGKGPRA
ncbi:MAG: PIG-L family deacetylase [bacterium]|nr:PIG-L family deacetylase [bacterium]